MTDVVAALIWDGDRFLACQRPANKSRALLWEFVGGKVEPGETAAEALIRECREELNVTVSPSDVFMEVVHEYPDITVRLILFNATVTDGTAEKLEHNDIRWITTGEIDNFQFCPADKDILIQLKRIDNALQASLYAQRDEAYQSFQSKLIPTMGQGKMLGVRMPLLRNISRMIPDIQTLGVLPHKFFEEDCLHGLLINRMNNVDEAIRALDEFLPYVDNWSVCDLLKPNAFCVHDRKILSAVERWLESDHPYTRRFAIGVLMKFYLDDNFDPAMLRRVAGLRSNDYYVNMMIAWYIATALAKRYDAAVTVLVDRLLDRWTHNKVIQKACESFRITPNQKSYLRTLKY